MFWARLNALKFASLDPFIIHTKPANNQIRMHTLRANLYANDKDFKQSWRNVKLALALFLIPWWSFHLESLRLKFFYLQTGWGRINPSNNALAEKLKQAKVPVVSHNQCRRTNGGTVHESSMVCVGGSGSSVCNGDSGGPLSCLENGKWVVRGAASWVTSRRCPINTFSVYARVSSYVDWINGYVGSEWSSNVHMRKKNFSVSGVAFPALRLV